MFFKACFPFNSIVKRAADIFKIEKPHIAEVAVEYINKNGEKQKVCVIFWAVSGEFDVLKSDNAYIFYAWNRSWRVWKLCKCMLIFPKS